ncbi:dicarboxylate/amino acid:cation symporter, partial [Bacillus sp. D-CC]
MLIALFLGLVVGLTLNLAAPSIFDPLNQYVFNPLGQLFIRLIKMLVVTRKNEIDFKPILPSCFGSPRPAAPSTIEINTTGSGGNFKTEGLK